MTASQVFAEYANLILHVMRPQQRAAAVPGAGVSVGGARDVEGRQVGAAQEIVDEHATPARTAPPYGHVVIVPQDPPCLCDVGIVAVVHAPTVTHIDREAYRRAKEIGRAHV